MPPTHMCEHVRGWHQATPMFSNRSQCCGVKWGARVLRVRSVSRGDLSGYIVHCLPRKFALGAA